MDLLFESYELFPQVEDDTTIYVASFYLILLPIKV